MPKHQRHTRLHHYLLGPPDRPVPHQERGTLEEIHLLPPAQSFLTSLLSDPTPQRAGLLFGQFSGSILKLHQAATGHRGLMIDPASPLHLDPRYAVGWADSAASLAPDLEWVGLWLVHGHRTLPDRLGSEEYLFAAYEKGLVDDDSVLMIAGWQDGRLSAEALQLAVEGIVRFEVTMASIEK